MSEENRFVQLMEEAYRHLEARSWDQAAVIGESLRRVGFTGGYEILARAWEGQGRRDRAITVLQEGVEKAPDLWVLWLMLGSTLGDAGRLEEAVAALRQALECPDVEASPVRLTLAGLLDRAGRYEEGLRELELVVDPPWRTQAWPVRIAFLISMQRFDKAIALGQVAQLDLRENEDPESLAHVFAQLGRAWWLGRQDGEQALTFADAALQHNPNNEDALWLIREVRGQTSSSSKRLKVVVRGRWPEAEGQPRQGFLRVYQVIADSPQEALDLVRVLEPVEIARTLEVDSFERLGAAQNEPKGVEARGGYVSFAEADEGQEEEEEE